MKRILIILVTVLTLFSVRTSAQTRWGVIAGMNFDTSDFMAVTKSDKLGWNAGLTWLVDLPLGFSLQPSLVYSQKNALMSDDVAQRMGYFELPVSVQWGPDLLVFRPFVDVTPYLGYAITNKTYVASGNAGISAVVDSSWNSKERLEYGLGLGGGINVWRLQILARYCWNFGSLYNLQGEDKVKSAFREHLKELTADNEHFGGVTLSVAYLF